MAHAQGSGYASTIATDTVYRALHRRKNPAEPILSFEMSLDTDFRARQDPNHEKHGLCMACDANDAVWIQLPCEHKFWCDPCKNWIFGIIDSKCYCCLYCERLVHGLTNVREGSLIFNAIRNILEVAEGSFVFRPILEVGEGSFVFRHILEVGEGSFVFRHTLEVAEGSSRQGAARGMVGVVPIPASTGSNLNPMAEPWTPESSRMSGEERTAFVTFSTLNPMAEPWTLEHSRMSVVERSLFVTFSFRFPLTEDEIHDFFTRRYGDCIESIYVNHPPRGEGPSLFGKVVFHWASMIVIVMSGREIVSLTVAGKSLWCQRFDESRQGRWRRRREYLLQNGIVPRL